MKKAMPKGANLRLEDAPAGVEPSAVTLVAEDSGAIQRGILWRPAGKRSKVGVHLMHPRLDQSLNYNIWPLVQAGYTVLGRAGRWPNDEIATIHEYLLLDVAAGVRRLREAGCEQVILLGNSGGGALATYYQSQAEIAPPGRLTSTPAGDPLDLNRFDLPPADGVVLIGAHPGEGALVQRWLDPSVVDESDPLLTDDALDMYSPDNGFRIPPEPSHYSADFLERFYAAKTRRAERLDEMARQRIAQRRQAAQRARELEPQNPRLAQHFQRIANAPDHIRLMRTLAHPAFVDPSIEPHEGRDVCHYGNNPRPDLANYQTFHAAYMTPEAYLSTRSGISSRANTVARLREVAAPLIVVHYAGDGVCHIRDAQEMHDAAKTRDKSLVIIQGADHYAFRITGPHQRGPRTFEGTDAVVAWMQAHFPV